MSQLEAKTNLLLSTLVTIMILLMIAITGLFIRMNQLQKSIEVALITPQNGGGQEIGGLKIGSEAPKFSLVDVNGSNVSSEDFKGHWTLIGFFSTTCPVCKTTYPHLKAFSESIDDLQLVLISKGSMEENKQVVQQEGFRFPVLVVENDSNEVFRDYQVPGTPFFYLIDENGIIQTIGYANTQAHLQLLVEGFLK